MNKTFTVEHEHVRFLRAQCTVKAGTGDGRGTGSVHNNLDLRDIFAYQFERVEQRGGADNGRPVLVVVHDRNIELLFQAFLYFKALGRGYVLQVYAAKGRFQNFDRTNKFIHIFGVEFQIETVNICVNLEEKPLSFHDRFSRGCADITQAKNGCTVGDDSYQITLGGVFIYVFRIFSDGKARFSHSG